jgi:hypothetical protein
MKHGAYQILLRNDFNTNSGNWTFEIKIRDEHGQEFDAADLQTQDRALGFAWLETVISKMSITTHFDYLHPEETNELVGYLGQYQATVYDQTRFCIFGEFRHDPGRSGIPGKPFVTEFKTMSNHGAWGKSFFLRDRNLIIMCFDPATDVYSGGPNRNIVNQLLWMSHIHTTASNAETMAPDDPGVGQDLLDLVTF